MSNLQVFENEMFGSIRVIFVDENPWFVGKEVAKALGYKDTSDALKRHVDSEDKLGRRFTDSGQSREMITINESGLYSLIMASKLPEAKAFKRWVTSEVLPSIRKHGGYIAGQEKMDDLELLSRAVLVANSVIEEKQKVIESQQSQIAEMDPKAKYYDALVACNHLTNFRDTAKLLGLGQKAFINWLLEKKFLYRDKRQRLLPYSIKNRGYFRIKEWGYGIEKAGVQTLITAKGRTHFLDLLDKEGLLVINT
ncbi:BRO family protein [Peptococcus simiae]|uniref:BRO family protein n=1 Tax=Peptococcus simiae TaxID=1643805 RepID=A0ABW9H2I1_9FIRM